MKQSAINARPWATVAVLVALSAIPEPADAQVLKRVRDRVQQRAETAAEVAADAAVSKAVDALLPKPEVAAAPTAESKLKPGEGAWANYDFVPGDRVLFADDFGRDRVGDFPRRFRLVEGSAEIVEWNGARYLSIPAFTTIAVPLPETLPKQFTIEFEFYAGLMQSRSYNPVLLFAPASQPRSTEDPRVIFGNREAGVMVGRQSMMTKLGEIHMDKLYTVRIMADGPHMKAYINERRVSNVPQVEITRTNELILHVPAWQEGPSLLGSIRIASGGLELYDKLEAEGRVAVQGVLFDTNSDRIRPESTPTLNEIAAMLRQNASLSLVVEGHTDNVGNAGANQTLSEKRAAAVVAFLTGAGVEASRLESRGFGDGKPVATNDSPEGRQQNRRVELVKR
jgi:OmpA-OmpF porin, OOP family